MYATNLPAQHSQFNKAIDVMFGRLVNGHWGLVIGKQEIRGIGIGLHVMLGATEFIEVWKQFKMVKTIHSIG